MKALASPWAFVAPALIVIGLFFLVPVLAALALSFTDFDLYALADAKNLRLIGFGNYIDVLRTPLFWKSLINTLYFVAVGVPLSIAASLGAALWFALFKSGVDPVATFPKAQLDAGTGLRTLIHMDDPHHRKVRAIGADWFRPKAMRDLKVRVDELATRYVDKLRDVSGPNATSSSRSR